MHYDGVSKIEKVEAELQKLSPQELRQVCDWLDNFVGDRRQLTAEFQSAVVESEKEMKKAELPDGTRVHVEAAEAGCRGSVASPGDPFRIGEQAVETGIHDLATNADHYLYGHPKVSHAG